jgi:serine/threonine protein kinase
MAEIYLASVATETPLNNKKRDDKPAEETGSTRQVAIKVIHRDNANDPDFVRMLVDEARLSVQLNHANIVHTYDLGKEKDQYYIVMEYIDGADLFKVQQRASAKHQTFPIALCAFIAREVARGLDFAHRLKDQDGRPLHIVHRDISPQNVLLSSGGAVKITDFGIAKAAHRAEQTQAGIIKGKYYYMSPEQAAGRLIDRRTDVFAAGILLYEMLVGEMLYYDEDLDRLLAMVRRADIAPPSRKRADLPQTLTDITMKALRKRADDRYQTAADFAAALDGFLGTFAADFGANDLGSFVARVMDSQRKGGRISDPTMSVTALPAVDGRDDNSPTVGLSSDQVRRLGIGVRDENSLIFQSQSRLMALLADSSGASVIGEGTGSGIATQSRHRAGHSGVIDDAELVATSPRDEAHARTLPRDERKTEIDPDLLETTNPLYGQTPRLRPASRNTPSGPTGDFSQRLAAYDFALDAQPAGSAARRNAASPLAFERLPQPALSERAMDVEASGSVRIPNEPKVELTQSDLYPQLDPALLAGRARASGSADAISNTATQEGLPPQPARVLGTPSGASGLAEPVIALSGASQGSLGSQSAQSYSALAPSSGSHSGDRAGMSLVQGPTRGRGLWGYVLTAVGAATFSSVITWNVATRSVNRPVEEPPADAAATVADLTPTLWVPEDAPTEEPPPAPLSPPPGATEGAAAAKAEETATKDSLGTVRVNSEPEGAEVYVQRKLVGKTPLELNEQPLDSDVKFELRMPGFKKKRKKLRWNGEQELDVTIKLEAEATGDTTAPSSDAPAPAAPSGGESSN